MDPISSLMVTEQPPAFIEDWFSTTLYTGTGASLDVTTGINLSAGDGMIWIKNRSSTASHTIFDTARGTVKYIKSDSTSSQVTSGTSLTSYNNDGFTVLHDGTKIESKRNRLLLFDGSKPHHSTNCTDDWRRININFNYF